jgi:hypothetical protein
LRWYSAFLEGNPSSEEDNQLRISLLTGSVTGSMG